MRRAPDPAVLMKDLRLVPPLYRTTPANARPSTQTPILYGNSDQVSSHASHIGCDGEAVWGAACCRREDRNATRFRRIRRRGGSWNGRASLGVGFGVGVAVCSESERSTMNTMMGSNLKSICKRSSIASVPRQEQVAGQIDAHTPIISISLQPLLFPRAGLLADPRAFRSSARITSTYSSTGLLP